MNESKKTPKDLKQEKIVAIVLCLFNSNPFIYSIKRCTYD